MAVRLVDKILQRTRPAEPIGKQTCVVCRRSLSARARVAWTVGRGRLHEECLANARVIAAEERLRSAPARMVPRLLRQMSVRVCASCLALRLRVSLQNARDLMRRLNGANGLAVIQMPCESCGRDVDTLFSDRGSPAASWTKV